MAKFIKIKMTPVEGMFNPPPEFIWRLLIDNEVDLFKYAKIDNHLNAEAFIHHNIANHPRGRALNMHRILSVEQIRDTGMYPNGKDLPENPIGRLNNIFTRKTTDMLNALDKGKTLCINYEGGYCYLEGALESWNGKIIETIEKPDMGFPIEADVINTDVLVLENDNTRISYTIKDYFKKNKITDYKAILSLKEIDLKYVLSAIKNAKTIALHSDFNDPEQVNTFLQVFSTLEPKNIVISSYSYLDLANLKEHALYQSCIDRHHVEFITT